MSMTIVLSGPAGVITQVKSALRSAGIVAQDTESDFGLQAPKTHGFVTVIGDDINAAHSAVEPLGWRLNAHWNNDPVESKDSALSLTPAELAAVRELLKAGK